ncbi:hypothetical protein ACFO1B_42605 [Dactylosporangium siamense]|uniref:Uncharacterized protein n=1 Tax=Dactylosporangium siamense TaxID=685454 RepID=A0A919UD62_9ACTN|nr:hypothetical protein [Dactylosporangium siamense]GIG51117.1 hypothetical protein Dsi01nite_091580 [Dactylosporangium siamense]
MLDPSADLDLRLAGLDDLVTWKHPKAYEALLAGARDPGFDGIGHEFGYRLAQFQPYDFAAGLLAEPLPESVWPGIDEWNHG